MYTFINLSHILVAWQIALVVDIEIYLEDLYTTWAGNGDYGGWISEDVTEKAKSFFLTCYGKP